MPIFITFEEKGDIVNVYGKTFYVKEELKKFGARWNINTWTIKSDVATEDLLARLNAMAHESITAEKKAEKKKIADMEALQAFYKTPEGKEQWWKEIEELKKTPVGAAIYQFICCKDCEVIDWKRQHTSCNSCGVDGNTFFVRGCLRTGD